MVAKSSVCSRARRTVLTCFSFDGRLGRPLATAISSKGEALWSEWYPLDRLKRIKRNTFPRFWSALYQQEAGQQGGGNAEADRRLEEEGHSVFSESPSWGESSPSQPASSAKFEGRLLPRDCCGIIARGRNECFTS